MRALFLAVFLGLSPAPALAQTNPSAPAPSLPDEARQALDRAEMLFKFVKMFIDYLPAYEAPTILPNGDILIRRKPAANQGSGQGPGTPETTTPAAAQKKS